MENNDYIELLLLQSHQIGELITRKVMTDDYLNVNDYNNCREAILQAISHFEGKPKEWEEFKQEQISLLIQAKSLHGLQNHTLGISTIDDILRFLNNCEVVYISKSPLAQAEIALTHYYNNEPINTGNMDTISKKYYGSSALPNTGNSLRQKYCEIVKKDNRTAKERSLKVTTARKNNFENISNLIKASAKKQFDEEYMLVMKYCEELQSIKK
jgi:hypothetical protein